MDGWMNGWMDGWMDAHLVSERVHSVEDDSDFSSCNPLLTTR